MIKIVEIKVLESKNLIKMNEIEAALGLGFGKHNNNYYIFNLQEIPPINKWHFIFMNLVSMGFTNIMITTT